MCLVSVFIPRECFFIVGWTVTYLNLAKDLKVVCLVLFPECFFIVGWTVSYVNLAKYLNAVYRLMQGKGEYLWAQIYMPL